MHAVDAAVGPEVHDNNFSAEFCNFEGAAGIQPFQPGWKFRGADAGLRVGHWGLLCLEREESSRWGQSDRPYGC
ncbi:MAG: hypothetical protein UZ16_OP3001000860 [Candidatus Hinthialibacteria bacterium OLB16]|nr:MAG: hypothetical protein UZ16_OP3001000860 [Candidatus Hinthialibacteria bacterium OLB16]